MTVLYMIQFVYWLFIWSGCGAVLHEVVRSTYVRW